MASNDYHFITRWRVEGTVHEVADILNDALSLPRWWPAVYLSVGEIAPGDASGMGRVIALHTRGWLPYTLRWQFRVTESCHPYGFSLDAWGDFVGRGIWALHQDGRWVDVVYDWKIRADKPLLRYGSPVLKPIFAANHRWAMARGEESLRLELLRRRAATSGDNTQMPAPPAPTTLSPVSIAVGTALLVGGGLAYCLARRRA